MVDEDPVEVIEDDKEARVVSGELAGLGLMVDALDTVLIDVNEDSEARFSEVDILVEWLLSKDSVLSGISCAGSWACPGLSPSS